MVNHFNMGSKLNTTTNGSIYKAQHKYATKNVLLSPDHIHYYQYYLRILCLFVFADNMFIVGLPVIYTQLMYALKQKYN